MRPAAHPDEWRPLTPGDGEPIDQLSRQEPWTEAQYLQLTERSRRLLEFTNGHLDILPLPTDQHQVIVRFLLLALFPRVLELGGTVLFAPLRLRVRDGKFREPDLLLVLDANDPRRGNDFWTGADLVIEVVSPDDPSRDTQDKRLDYAEARIPEYWIVNPLDETVTVLVLRGGRLRGTWRLPEGTADRFRLPARLPARRGERVRREVTRAPDRLEDDRGAP